MNDFLKDFLTAGAITVVFIVLSLAVMRLACGPMDSHEVPLPPEVDSVRQVEDSIQAEIEIQQAAADRAVAVLDSARETAERIIAEAAARAEDAVDSIHAIALTDTADAEGDRDFWIALSVENLHGWQAERTKREAWEKRATAAEVAVDSLLTVNASLHSLVAAKDVRIGLLEGAVADLGQRIHAANRSRDRWRTATGVVSGGLAAVAGVAALK